MFSPIRTSRSKSALAAFTLIELAIVLGIVGVVGGGLWRLMSNSGQQTKDTATAAQQGALINAVKGYLASTEGQYWMGTTMGSTLANPANLPLPSTNTNVGTCKTAMGADTNLQAFCNFLPAGFTSGTTNPYGQIYAIQVLKDGTTQGIAPVTYSFMIVASGVTIPDANGGRISSLIGGDGGFVYANPLCSLPAAVTTTACGALGAWSDSITTYGFAPLTGAVASRTFVSATTNSSMQWLSRIPDLPSLTLNTMTTDMYMGQTSAPVPTNIHLGNDSSQIYGAYPTTSALLSQTAAISLVAPSKGAYGPTPPIYISTDGCSMKDFPGGLPNGYGGPCPTTSSTDSNGVTTTVIVPAINITYGDLNLANGNVEALKVFSASDARLKTDIHKIQNPLNDLMKLDAVSFTFKDGGSKGMGVTAQNLEKVYPQLITVQSEGMKFVDYNGLIGPLIGAVQELKMQNDDLRDRLRKQELRENNLEQELAKKK